MTSAERSDDARILLIADLSGYTGYLVSGEAEEAPLIAGDLVQTIVDAFAGDYELGGLEGDAVFVHAPAAGVSGSSVLAGIARCYGAFRRRIESVRQATTCTCNACQQASDLDLKFFVHVGGAVPQRIAGRDELAGRDVILVHRLLKDSAPAATGMRSYVLLTEAAVTALAIDPAVSGLERVHQSYEHFGEVVAYVGPPTGGWDGSGSVGVGEGEVELIDLERHIATPRSSLWDLLTVPTSREAWEGIEHVDEMAGQGERGVGTLSRCVAQRLASVEQILDWRPPSGFARRTEYPGVGAITARYDLDEVAGGSRLRVRWSGADGVDTVPQWLEDRLRRGLDRLSGVATG